MHSLTVPSSPLTPCQASDGTTSHQEVSATWDRIMIAAPNEDQFKRYLHTTIEWKDCLVMFGGESETLSNDAVLFDMQQLTLRKLGLKCGSKPNTRSGHAAVLYEDQMYVFGGQKVGLEDMADMWKLDFAADSWESVEAAPPESAPFPVRGHAAVAYGSQMLMYGGLGATSLEQGGSGEGDTPNFSNNLHIFDFATCAWTRVACADVGQPLARHGHTLSVVNSRIIMFGGCGRDGLLNDTWEFDTSSLEWRELCPSNARPDARWQHTTTGLGGCLVLFGGKSSDGALNDLWFLDLQSLEWSRWDVWNRPGSRRRDAAAPSPRSGHSLCRWQGNRLAVVCGCGSDSKYSKDELWLLDTGSASFPSPLPARSPSAVSRTSRDSGASAWQRALPQNDVPLRDRTLQASPTVEGLLEEVLRVQETSDMTVDAAIDQLRQRVREIGERSQKLHDNDGRVASLELVVQKILSSQSQVEAHVVALEKDNAELKQRNTILLDWKAKAQKRIEVLEMGSKIPSPGLARRRSPQPAASSSTPAAGDGQTSNEHTPSVRTTPPRPWAREVDDARRLVRQYKKDLQAEMRKEYLEQRKTLHQYADTANAERTRTGAVLEQVEQRFEAKLKRAVDGSAKRDRAQGQVVRALGSRVNELEANVERRIVQVVASRLDERVSELSKEVTARVSKTLQRKDGAVSQKQSSDLLAEVRQRIESVITNIKDDLRSDLEHTLVQENSSLRSRLHDVIVHEVDKLPSAVKARSPKARIDGIIGKPAGDGDKKVGLVDRHESEPSHELAEASSSEVLPSDDLVKSVWLRADPLSEPALFAATYDPGVQGRSSMSAVAVLDNSFAEGASKFSVQAALGNKLGQVQTLGLEVGESSFITVLSDRAAHKCAVTSMDCCGSVIASGAEDGSVVVYDTVTEARTLSLTVHDKDVYGIQVDPIRMLTCSRDRTVRLYDFRRSASVATFTGHQRAVLCCKYIGSMMASAGGDRTLMLWDMEQGRNIGLYRRHANRIRCLDFDGQTVMTGSNDNSIFVWDVRLGEGAVPVAVLKGPYEGGVTSVRFDSTSVLSTCSANGTLVVHDRRNFSAGTMDSASQPRHAIQWSPDAVRAFSVRGSAAASVHPSGSVKLGIVR